MTDPSSQSQTLMAFDFGSQKMGIAVGSSLTGTGQPLSLFAMRDGIPDWRQLKKIIAQWQPDVFLVGLPLNMDDSESELSLRARKFARRLKHQTNTATWMVDERLSTRDARDTLSHYQSRGQAKKVSADSLAAVLLIESWCSEPIPLTP